MSMRSAEQNEKDHGWQQLRQEYEEAFRRWAEAAAENTQRKGETAKLEDAVRTYVSSRNELAAFLTTRLRPRTSSQREHVHRVAYMLWERAGRPQGTAEADWYQAERLVTNDPVLSAVAK